MAPQHLKTSVDEETKAAAAARLVARESTGLDSWRRARVVGHDGHKHERRAQSRKALLVAQGCDEGGRRGRLEGWTVSATSGGESVYDN